MEITVKERPLSLDNCLTALHYFFSRVFSSSFFISSAAAAAYSRFLPLSLICTYNDLSNYLLFLILRILLKFKL